MARVAFVFAQKGRMETASWRRSSESCDLSTGAHPAPRPPTHSNYLHKIAAAAANERETKRGQRRGMREGGGAMRAVVPVVWHPMQSRRLDSGKGQCH
jgi:hypothetical protein